MKKSRIADIHIRKFMYLTIELGKLIIKIYSISVCNAMVNVIPNFLHIRRHLKIENFLYGVGEHYIFRHVTYY